MIPAKRARKDVERLRAAQRPGQAVFNALAQVDPEFADRVRGTELDPFHDDTRIAGMLAWWRDVLIGAEAAEEGRGARALVAQREAVAAELAPMARAADALRAAAVAAGHPAEDEDPEAQLHAVRAAAWSMGSEVMRTAAVAVCRRVEDYHGPDPMRRGWPAQVGAGDCLVNIQELPIPPCPRGACAATATETH